MGHRFAAATVLGAACLAAAASAAAADWPAGLRLGGFVSQGWLNTSESEYLVPRSQDGTAEMTEAAVTVSATPADRLRVGVQLLARNFGDEGDDRVILDWGYLDYRWRDLLGVRAGKVKLPLGLYNEQRDLDFLRTGVFLPQAVYNEGMREFVLAYEGLGGYGSLPLGAAGELDYHLYAGTLNVPDASRGFWAANYEPQAETLEPLVETVVAAERDVDAADVEATFSGIVSPRVTFPYVWGGAAVWAPPLPGLRLGGSVLTGRFTYRAELRYDVAVRDPGAGTVARSPFGLDVDETWDINRIAVWSAEYAWRDLLLAAEFYDEQIEVSTPAGWYAAADWRTGAGFSLAVHYSCYWRDKHDRDGAALAELGLPGHYGWQKDLAAGVRVDLDDRWLVKAEYHRLDGLALARWRSLQAEAADPGARRWGMITVRTTVHF